MALESAGFYNCCGATIIACFPESPEDAPSDYAIENQLKVRIRYTEGHMYLVALAGWQIDRYDFIMKRNDFKTLPDYRNVNSNNLIRMYWKVPTPSPLRTGGKQCFL